VENLIWACTEVAVADVGTRAVRTVVHVAAVLRWARAVVVIWDGVLSMDLAEHPVWEAIRLLWMRKYSPLEEEGYVARVAVNHADVSPSVVSPVVVSPVVARVAVARVAVARVAVDVVLDNFTFTVKTLLKSLMYLKWSRSIE
jgi:hypothetical protein